jgi:hypothetical protein
MTQIFGALPTQQADGKNKLVSSSNSVDKPVKNLLSPGSWLCTKKSRQVNPAAFLKRF